MMLSLSTTNSGRLWDVTTQARPYHHGNLREELVQAAVVLAEEGGPEAVVLREVSRRAGVSHNAAYRHFADREALLAAVCEVGMTGLSATIDRELAGVAGSRTDPAVARLRMRACGRGYVHFALAQPGLFRTAFAIPASLPDPPPDAGDRAAPSHPYGQLGQRLDDLVSSGALPPERRPLAEIAAWSAVHGLSVLLIDGPLRALSAAEREVAIERVLSTVLEGL